MYTRFIIKLSKKINEQKKFFWKTILYLWTPGGYGNYRKLRKLKEINNLFENKKTGEQKIKEWMNCKKTGLQYRKYNNYEEYTAHQKQKLDLLLKSGLSFSNKDIFGFRYLYYRRFNRLSSYLPSTASIICAGARLGTEVEVLRDLGFRNAYGIDLNPGPDNPFVRVGDFMKIEASDASLDMIYSNCLDHAYDLDAFFAEHARVIKSDGYVYYDISLKESGNFESAAWESAEDLLSLLLKYFKTIIHVSTEKDWKSFLLQGKKG